MSFYSHIADFYDEIFPFQSITFDFLKSYCSKEAKIMDFGCGTGKYISMLNDYVNSGIGIDINPEMIEKATLTYPDNDFRVLDILEIEKLNTLFSFIFSTGNVVSYFDSHSIEILLKNINSALLKDGKWIFQTVNWDKLEGIEKFTFPEKKISSNEMVFKRYYSRLNENQIEFNIELVKEGLTIFKSKDVLYSISSAEMIDLHTNAGFKLVSHFGNFQKTVFEKDKSPASIYVFSK